MGKIKPININLDIGTIIKYIILLFGVIFSCYQYKNYIDNQFVQINQDIRKLQCDLIHSRIEDSINRNNALRSPYETNLMQPTSDALGHHKYVLSEINRLNNLIKRLEEKRREYKCSI